MVLMGGLGLALVAGASIALNLAALAVIAMVLFASIAVTSPAARFAIVVAGGLLVFRSSDQLDAPKLIYLVWVGLCTAVAIARLAGERERSMVADIQPLLLSTAGVMGALALSLAVAASSGTPLVDWFRDAAPYGLLAASPFLAWEGARSRLGSHMEAAVVAAGLMATVAFAVEWLGRRGLADLLFATFGSSSIMLSALVFVAAIAAILSHRRRRLLWVTVASAVLALLLLTGTRSALVLLVGPVAMVVFTHGQRYTRTRRLVGTVFVVGFSVVALAFLASQSGVIDVARLSGRLGSIVSLGSNLSADQSFVERATQLRVASSAFAGSPVVGVGLGYRFEWAASGAAIPSYTIDTGLSIAAKFGLIGTGLFGIAVSGVVSFFRRFRMRLPEHVRMSFVGFAAISIAILPLGNPFEDKGFGLAAVLLGAWALASARDNQEVTEHDRAVRRELAHASRLWQAGNMQN